MDTAITILFRDIRESYRSAYDAYVKNDTNGIRKYIKKARMLSRDLLFELGGEHEDNS